MRRVYFLGAGASKSIYPYLPTAQELTLARLLDRDNYLNDEARSWPLDSCISFLDSHSKSRPKGFRERRIEEVLGCYRDDERLFWSLITCLIFQLWVDQKDGGGVVTEWLKLVSQRGDTILTTNYDTIIERGVSRFPRPRNGQSLKVSGLIDFGVPEDMLLRSGKKNDPCPRFKPIKILKLHGSISWRFCKGCKQYDLHPTSRFGAVAAIADDSYFLTDCPVCRKQTAWSPVLVPPLKEKEIGERAIQEIWKAAKKSLQSAKEIVFAGFSLDESDSSIRKLLAEAHKRANTSSVIIVDPNTSRLKDRYGEIYRPDIEKSTYSDWKEYLTEELKKTGAP